MDEMDEIDPRHLEMGSRRTNAFGDVEVLRRWTNSPRRWTKVFESELRSSKVGSKEMNDMDSACNVYAISITSAALVD